MQRRIAMSRIKVHELHINGIKRRLNLLPPEFETAICKKYGVSDIELLNATDYDEIIDTINDYRHKINFEMFN